MMWDMVKQVRSWGAARKYPPKVNTPHA
jgi:hypothetical protein